MKTMTFAEWIALPKDRKLRKERPEGMKVCVDFFVLTLDKDTGETVLAPVTLVNE